MQFTVGKFCNFNEFWRHSDPIPDDQIAGFSWYAFLNSFFSAVPFRIDTLKINFGLKFAGLEFDLIIRIWHTTRSAMIYVSSFFCYFSRCFLLLIISNFVFGSPYFTTVSTHSQARHD